MAEREQTKKRKLFSGEMPHNLEAEQALLGCIILDPAVQSEIVSFIAEDDFYSETHKTIFNAMKEMVSRNQTIDLVTLSDFLEKNGTINSVGGIEYLSQLVEVIPSPSNYANYQEIVTRDGILRRLMSGAAEIIDKCRTTVGKNEALAFAEKIVYDVSQSQDSGSIVKASQIIPSVMKTFDELSKNKGSYRGIRTKFKGLDNLINGFQKGTLNILAARPGVGKTTLAMNMVENIARQGYSCAVFSLEMKKEELMHRLICSVAGISSDNVLKGRLVEKEWMKVIKANDILSNEKLFIDDSSLNNPQNILSKCRRIKRKYGLDFVMIDYIQLMQIDKYADNRQMQITDMSRNLKILAKEIDVPVLALSQLNRAVESRKGRPQLSDLRESGAIEQDADIVMFIHRPDKYATEKDIAENKVIPNVAELIIEKNRSGAQGLVKLFFQGECTRFLNLNDDTGTPELFDDDPVADRSNQSQPDMVEMQDPTGVLSFSGEAEPPFEEEPAGNIDDEVFK